MTQALAIITQSSTYIPLMAVQQRRHGPGYTMPAAPLTAGEVGQASHYAAVRSRLLGARPVQANAPRRAWSWAPAPLPVLPPVDQPEKYDPGVSWRVIVARVAYLHGVKIRDILSESRSRKIVAARHEAIYHIVVETGLSLPDIGRRLNRDHTTILHGFRKHKERLSTGEAPKRPMILKYVRENASLKERCQEVVKAVAVKFGVSTAQIYGNQRRADLFKARQEIFLTLYRDHGLNYSEIGQGVGDRDHVTIINHIGHLVAPQFEAAAG